MKKVDVVVERVSVYKVRKKAREKHKQTQTQEAQKCM
jgi:hypothetical protein